MVGFRFTPDAFCGILYSSRLTDSHPSHPRVCPMLSLLTSPTRLCDGISRREALTIGSLGALGVENAKPGAPNDWPSMGGVVRKLLQPQCRLPAAVTLPEQMANDGNLPWPGQDAGFVGRAADPWLINCEPEKGKFEVPGLALPADVTAPRCGGRKGL